MNQHTSDHGRLRRSPDGKLRMVFLQLDLWDRSRGVRCRENMQNKGLLIGIIVVCAAIIVASFFFGKNAKAPTATSEGIVNGQVLLGPTCPVERIPPDPRCAPRPYATAIGISTNIETPSDFMTINSNASGTFSVSLPAGEYLFRPHGGSVYPRCDESLVTIAAGVTTSTVISCDTGIR
jgi:hypothetical protein